jgi:hypothetical protein
LQCNTTATEVGKHQALVQFAQQCMDDEPAKRPSLAQVCAKLDLLQASAT